MVTIDPSQPLTATTWRLSWSSDLTPGDDPITYWLYRDGELVGTTTLDEWIISVEPGESPVFDILDAEPAAGTQPAAFPARITLQWYAPAAGGVAHYRVEELVGATWTLRKRIRDDGSGLLHFESRPLEDSTTFQFRVIPVGVNGNPGTSSTLNVLMVRHPDVPPVTFGYTPTTPTRSDNFNRANGGSLGTPSDAGSAWTVLNGTWGIASNQAANQSPAGSTPRAVVVESGLADALVKVTIKTSTDTEARVVFRASDNNNYWYTTCDAGVFDLYKRVAGTFTLIETNPVELNPGDAILVRLSGSSIKVYLNDTSGTPIFDVSDSFNQSATKHGLGTFSNEAVLFDDFSVAPVAAGAVTIAAAA